MQLGTQATHVALERGAKSGKHMSDERKTGGRELTFTLNGPDAFPADDIPDADRGVGGSRANEWSTGLTVQLSQGPDGIRVTLKGTM